jgi:hypothetical protein
MRRVISALLLLPALAAGRWPAAGGTVTIYIPPGESGDAIAHEAVARATRSFLVSPDGARARIRVEASGAGTWTVALDPDLAPIVPELADSLREAARRDSSGATGLWSNLTACEARAGPEPRLHLTFDRPVCNPIARFGRWPLPASIESPPFTQVGPQELRRTPDAFVPPRLDAIRLVRAAPPEAPLPGEIAVVPVRGAAGAQETICVAFRIRAEPGAGAADVARLRRAFASSEFAPLLPPEARCEIPALKPPEAGYAAGPDSGGTALAGTSISPLRVRVRAGAGEQSRLIFRRMRLLGDARGLEVVEASARDAPVGGVRAVGCRIEAVAIFGIDPVSEWQLCESGDRAPAWEIFSIGFAVFGGPDVVGSIGAPERLWIAAP